MNLPLVFVLLSAAGGLFFALWLGFMFFAFILKAVSKKAGKTNTRISHRQAAVPFADMYSNKPSDEDIPFGHDEEAFAPAQNTNNVPLPDDSIKPSSLNTPPAQDTSGEKPLSTNQIKLDTREDLKKAIIYHEIFDTKF